MITFAAQQKICKTATGVETASRKVADRNNFGTVLKACGGLKTPYHNRIQVNPLVTTENLNRYIPDGMGAVNPTSDGGGLLLNILIGM